MRLFLVMKTQHDSIDTASDLRDLIAQTPEETQERSESCIQIRHEDFAEMRMLLLKLRSEVYYISHMNSEEKTQLDERTTKVLNSTDWFKVKFVR